MNEQPTEVRTLLDALELLRVDQCGKHARWGVLHIGAVTEIEVCISYDGDSGGYTEKVESVFAVPPELVEELRGLTKGTPSWGYTNEKTRRISRWGWDRLFELRTETK